MTHGVPGVIKSNLGRVKFTQDVLTVKIEMKPVIDFISSLRSAQTRLADLLDHYDLTKLDNNTMNLIRAQKERLDMMLPSRRKRVLFSFGGDSLHSVFGTATDKQVHAVNYKLALLEKWAEDKGKVM